MSDLLADPAAVAANPGAYRVLTGDRPTGRLHLGHYLGTLRSRIALQQQGVELFVVVADYQVITDRTVLGDIRARALDSVIDHLALGLDPQRSTIFVHSQIRALNQLVVPLLSLATLPELRRNPTVKAELADSGMDVINGLLLTYPVHQACDILALQANLVPVGDDQLPHLEQTRVVARRFNDRYAGGRQVLPEPQALLSPAPRVLGLDGHKMSKSRGNAIQLAHTADETAALVRRAVTDSERRITYEPDRRPEVANLLMIAALLRSTRPEVLADEIGDGGGSRLKAVVTEAVNDHLAPVRARRRELEADPGYALGVLREGAERVSAIAEQTLTEVHEALGMAYV